MKKVLSLVLAVMLTIGMTTVAFAALDLSDDSTVDYSADAVTAVVGSTIVFDGKKLDKQATNGSSEEWTGFTGAAGTWSNAISKLRVDIDNDGYNAKVTVTLRNVTSLIGDVAAEDVTVTSTHASAKDLTIKFPALKVTAASVSDLDKVPASWKITGFNEDWKGTWAPKSKKIVDGADGIDQKDLLPIEASMFNWEYKKGGTTYKVTDVTAEGVAADAKLRSSQLSNVGVRRVYQKGTNGTIRDVTLMDSDSEVRVRTVKFYQKTGDTDVELKIGLTFKSKTSDELVYEYSFNMENREELIEEGQNECVSYGAVFQKADATVRDVTFEGDEDGIVFATKTVVKGQKYYFNVDSELSDDDAKIVADNPEVDSIYTVYSVNMANATVKFKNLDREFFVYDSEGKLLGTTKDSKLPLAKKYILTTAKVDFGGADEEPVEEPAEEPADVDAPPMGGGEVPPSNNYNPNTGL